METLSAKRQCLETKTFLSREGEVHSSDGQPQACDKIATTATITHQSLLCSVGRNSQNSSIESNLISRWINDVVAVLKEQLSIFYSNDHPCQLSHQTLITVSNSLLEQFQWVGLETNQAIEPSSLLLSKLESMTSEFCNHCSRFDCIDSKSHSPFKPQSLLDTKFKFRPVVGEWSNLLFAQWILHSNNDLTSPSSSPHQTLSTDIKIHCPLCNSITTDESYTSFIAIGILSMTTGLLTY